MNILVGHIGEGSTRKENPAARLFADMPAREQRQALRWLIQDPDAAHTTPHLDELLRRALRVGDLEVRLTAMLAAARLRAHAILPELQAATPSTWPRNLEERERRFHGLLWKGAIQYLQGQRHPGNAGSGRAPLMPLWHVLAGNLEVMDETSLLLHALSTPLEEGRRPRSLPSGVLEQDGQYVLRQSGLPLRWVAPVAHWLGGPSPRRVCSEGFFVARMPMSRALVTWMSQPAPSRPPPARGEVWLGELEEAERLCQVLSRIEQVPLRLPTADEWEMVARGTDGRRFPWGNLPELDGEHRPSPWGAEDVVGDRPEWTFDEDARLPLLRGGVETRTWVRHFMGSSWHELTGALRFIVPDVRGKGRASPPRPATRYLQ